MGQEKQTFSPLPAGARVISEKDGERIAEWNGITLVHISKEKQSQQPVPTVEEALSVRRNAKPKKVRPPDHDRGREVDSPSQPQLDPTRLVPSRNKKNSQPLLDSPDLGLKKR